MKKETIIQICIIVILVVILGILVKITIEAINSNTLENEMQIGNDMQEMGGSQIEQGQTTTTENNGVTEITEDAEISSGTYASENTDENAILVTGEIDATLSNIEVTKTGDSDGGDNTSFYGTNSAIIAKNGANLILKNITVTTEATGANGVFSYGGSATTSNTSSDGTTVTISDSTITTSKDNSGGIMTTGGGIMNAYNLTITTAGISSAAIRTDRGGGTVKVDRRNIYNNRSRIAYNLFNSKCNSKQCRIG